MRPVFRRPATALTVAFGVAICLGCASTSSGNRRDSSLITQEQILEHRFNNAYEAVQALHSNWLLTKGTDSFSSPSQVRVYVDNTLLGGVETLKSISARTVYSIRHFDGISATARWGMDHGQGVIFISTQP